MTDHRRRTEIAQWIKRKTNPATDTQNIAAALIDHPPATVLSLTSCPKRRRPRNSNCPISAP